MLNKPTPDAANRSCPYLLQYKKSIPGPIIQHQQVSFRHFLTKSKTFPVNNKRGCLRRDSL